MPVFTLEIPTNANSKKDIEGYRDVIKEILEELLKTDESQPLRELLLELDKLDDDPSDPAADYKKLNFNYYPRLWSKTSRAGASNIYVKIADDEDKRLQYKNLSLYERIHNELTRQLKELPWFNAEASLKKANINAALNKLEAWQHENVQAYLERMRKASADELLAQLKEIEEMMKASSFSNQYSDLCRRIKLVMEFDTSTLHTTADVFNFTDNVNTLRNDLLKFNKKLLDANNDRKLFPDLTPKIERLSVIAKRESDYYYDNPRDRTTLDKVRDVATNVVSAIGTGLIISGIVCLAIPGLQPVGAGLLLGGMIALLPVANLGFEVARNFYYGRSPTKSQAIQFSIAIAMISTLMFGLHALPGLAAGIFGKASATNAAISKGVEYAGTKVIPPVMATDTSRVTATGFHSMHKQSGPKLDKHVNDKKVIDFHTGVTLFHDQEKDLKKKGQIILTTDQLEKQIGRDHKVGYIFKSHHSIQYRKSHNYEISKWRASLFASDHANEIEKRVKKYAELPANAKLEEREKQLRSIESLILSQESSKESEKTKTHLGTLHEWVSNEIAVLTDIQQHQHANDKTVYHIKKP